MNRITDGFKAIPVSRVAAMTGLLLCGSLCAESVCFADQRAGAEPPSQPHRLRVRSGLQALYDFRSSTGKVVHDQSGAGEPVNLEISDLEAVKWSQGSLEVREKTLIRSTTPATRISNAIRLSGEITVEAWVRPAKTQQAGPARIVTLSGSISERNMTLGQEGDRFDVRFRTTETDANGNPSVRAPEKSLQTELTHVVYTRDRTGRARLYLNGELAADQTIAGATTNWKDSFHLGLANELTGERPWLGTYHLIAIYSRDLLPHEVARHFRAGADAQTEPAGVAASKSRPQRARSGLQALYDFHSSSGKIIPDQSNAGEPINLEISDLDSVTWKKGSLEVHGKTLIRSEKPASRLTESIRRSGEITIEAWVKPAKVQQAGPARIVTLSGSGSERNFTLGQDGDRFDVRFRTIKTNVNGLPSVSSPKKSLTTERIHLVYTRDRTGRTRLYLNGELTVDQAVVGDTTNWNEAYRLALANELTKDRAWLGTYYLVAIYNRDLLPHEVSEHFRAGPDGETAPASLAEVSATASDDQRLFQAEIAPLFAQHCLECHDSVTKKGGLDLSKKSTAVAGGENGQPIVSGKAEDSLLWQYVESDEMPLDRSPLSSREKQFLRQWIDAGATWSLEMIDPATFAHAEQARQNWLRRLTVEEYIETVRCAVGVDIEDDARRILPPDLRADGFSNTAYNLNVDLGHVEAYARLAEIIVDRMDVTEFASQFSKNQKLTDDDMRGLIAKMGKWILRGPLEEHEIVTLRGISTTVASAGGDFEEAVRYVLEAMLQSPRFLYRVENQRGDGTAWPVGDYELASRMSYIIWGAPPDKELMRAADAGELYDRRNVEAQVHRMLQDPRTIKRSARFVSEWLNLARLSNLNPNPDKFPHWNDTLANDMREETLAYFQEVVWNQNRPLADLLNAQVTFATPQLAKHYGLDPKGKGLERYDVSSVPSRGGLLTQGSVLTVGGDEASMVTRGLFVLHDLLRGAVKDPPPCVDTTPVPTKPGLTKRAIAEARIANSSCGGCHVKFEPLAFGLERFDGLGAYHERDEHGNTLRHDGKVLFPGTAEPVPYQTSAELMDVLAKSDRVSECLTWKVAQFALGRPLGAADAPHLGQIHERAQREGGTYASLITAIVMSDLVQTTQTEGNP